ncbi:MAG: histidinol dehydrogenase [Clostridia bacterium]
MFEVTCDVMRVEEKLAARNQLDQPDVIMAVSEIMADIRRHGDAALRKYTLRHDKCQILEFKVSETEIEKAYGEIDPGFLGILQKAIDNIRQYHERQSQESFLWEKEKGILLGQRITPLERVGIYIPGGTAPLVSSVLMNAVPAVLAGVDRIIMCTPPRRDGTIDAERLVAAREAGVTDIYKAGGAQAIFAMAFGTESIPRVDKITGPGNIYVANAKKMAYGYCDIDMIAGPSEIMVIADESANPAYVAADLLSQAEHDEQAGTVLCCRSRDFADRVNGEVQKQWEGLARRNIAGKSIRDYGIIYVNENLMECVDCANRIAPEHLELHVEKAMDFIPLVRNAGAIFIGEFSPEPLGDYYAGPNHTLPTGGTARFYSPLGVYDFCKKTSIIKYDQDALRKVHEEIETFARKEELDAHARAISIRFEGEDDGKPSQ